MTHVSIFSYNESIMWHNQPHDSCFLFFSNIYVTCNSMMSHQSIFSNIHVTCNSQMTHRSVSHRGINHHSSPTWRQCGKLLIGSHSAGNYVIIAHLSARCPALHTLTSDTAREGRTLRRLPFPACQQSVLTIFPAHHLSARNIFPASLSTIWTCEYTLSVK